MLHELHHAFVNCPIGIHVMLINIIKYLPILRKIPNDYRLKKFRELKAVDFSEINR
jgi:hypothetical protein